MEKEIELVHNMNRELGEIKAKLEENHQVHLDNREDIQAILIQTTKTNGRVSSLEDTTKILSRVESQNSGLITSLQNGIKDTNRVVDELKKYKDDGVIKKESNRAYYFRLVLERALIPLVIFIGSLVLVKTGIINISPEIRNTDDLESKVLELQHKAKELENNNKNENK